MFRLEGDFGAVIFERNGSSNYITIPTETAVRFFRKLSILYPDVANNELGLYSFAEVGRDGQARFASLGLPQHILQSRKSGCSWNPKGRIPVALTEAPMCPVEYNGEQCPDIFYGSCLERIFGVGNQIRDFFATEEGRKLFAELLNRIFLGLGNSFYELLWWGQHPLIAESDAGGWYTVDPKQWFDYMDQQDACGGFYTLMDHYKNVEGLDNFNAEIYENETNPANREEFIGDAFAAIDRVLAKAKGAFSLALQTGTLQGKVPVISVTPGIFDKAESELVAKFQHIPDIYSYYLKGINGDRTLLPGVMKYKGFNIVKNHAAKIFDDITGTVTHRIVVGIPGVLGIAHDVPDLKQFTGMGMRITQHLDAPWQGKVFMDTAFKMNASILDTSMMAMASLTFTP